MAYWRIFFAGILFDLCMKAAYREGHIRTGANNQPRKTQRQDVKVQMRHKTHLGRIV